LGRNRIPLQVRQCLSHSRFDSSAISPYLAQEHRPLDCGNAKIRHLFLVGISGESGPGFLFDEECR
jgi:hypothetical protein